MKLGVAQHNVKFMTWAPVKLWSFYYVYYMNFNNAVCRKRVFFSKSQRSLLIDIGIKPFVSVNKEE